jgi:sulfur carrier protein
MEIILNDIRKKIESNSTLLSFANLEIGSELNGIAIAVNETVIPKSDWTNYLLKENDNLLIIKATQGG